MEIYCYRVVFPFGVSIRVSPAIEAEKTGEVLPCGTIIESTKSIILDGVNYVKLSDDRGWIFSMKDDVPVLDLIEVRRIPPPSVPIPMLAPPSMSTPRKNSRSDSGDETSPSSSELSFQGLTPRTPSPEFTEAVTTDHTPSAPSMKPRRNLSQYLLSPGSTRGNGRGSLWKDMRLKVRTCSTFADFSRLVQFDMPVELKPPAIPEPGPARSAWMSSMEDDHIVLIKISLLASITRHCVEMYSDISGLEAHLWVISHLGAADVSHVLRLFDQAAQQRFDRIESVEFRMAMLGKLNEVNGQTKVHAVELGRRVDILPDDIRHFLQRWVIIKVSYSGEFYVCARHGTDPLFFFAQVYDRHRIHESADARVLAEKPSSSQKEASMESTPEDWTQKSQQLWRKLIVSCTGDLFVEGVEDEDIYLSRSGKERPVASASQLPPSTRTVQAMQLLKTWWVDTQQYTRNVVMDPDYHVPVGL